MNDLQTLLVALARKHKVPGASVAVLEDGQISEAVAGVVNRRTRVRTTPDSLFQIGSITKVYTATLVMQLVDAGRVDLDLPVRTYLPEFDVGDEAAAAAITVRQLLTHTSGIQGDYFADFGRGEDCVERYVASLPSVGMIHQPGAMWSYSNAAYVVAGRLVEKLTGLTYENALREKLLDPAGLAEHAALAEDAILFRTAVGHQPGRTRGRAEVVLNWQLPRSSSPAGATLCATARDVVRFALLHMNGGRAEDGTQVLSPGSAKAMQQFQVARPVPLTRMGLGWVLTTWSNASVVWHNGGTIGQSSHLYLLPDHGFAMCILTNASTGPNLIDELGPKILRERFGLEPPALPMLPEDDPEIDLGAYAATYERHGVRIVVEPEERHLRVSMQVALLPGEVDEPPQVIFARPLDAQHFALTNENGDVQGRTVFLDFDDGGRPRYLFLGRVNRRVEAR